MSAIDTLRLKASYGTLAMLWVNAAWLAAAGLFAPAGFSIAAVGAGLVLGAVATVFWSMDKAGATTRIVNSMALAAQVSLLVYAFQGSAYQIDMHMYFFATLAICAAWVDWRAIIAYAALVAVHHLLLYIVMPAAVFPDQSDFSRVLIHAVILVLQAGALIGLTSAIVRAFASAAQSAEQAQTAHQLATRAAADAAAAEASIAAERSAGEAERAREAVETQAAVDIIAKALDELSAGNLGFRVTQPLNGRMDGLRQSFNASLDRLEGALSNVGRAADSVRNDAASIRGSNDDLAHRTERQAASLEQTAAAMSQISQGVTGTAKLADDVARMVDKTKVGAEKSASVVSDAISAMSRIEESSSRIGQIIGVIDEIAFQTNLLALNAGVEAARAGEAGKGFAVVAQEVRELAQRSANAAKEIKALVTQSAEHVRHGVDLVGETGSALRTIEGEVQEISIHILQIVSAARDQSDGVGSINQALGVIDMNTQQFAGLLQETTASVGSLVSEAERLEALLAHFKMSGQGASRSLSHRYAA